MTAIVAIARVLSYSTFGETCLATEVQKSLMKRTMLHGATLAEIWFASPLSSSFSEDFQQVPVTLAKFKHIDNCVMLFVCFYPNFPSPLSGPRTDFV